MLRSNALGNPPRWKCPRMVTRASSRSRSDKTFFTYALEIRLPRGPSRPPQPARYCAAVPTLAPHESFRTSRLPSPLPADILESAPSSRPSPAPPSAPNIRSSPHHFDNKTALMTGRGAHNRIYRLHNPMSAVSAPIVISVPNMSLSIEPTMTDDGNGWVSAPASGVIFPSATNSATSPLHSS